MTMGLGPKQLAVLEKLKDKRYITTTEIKNIYGYTTVAIAALRGLEARGYLKFIDEGRWSKGPKYSEAIQ